MVYNATMDVAAGKEALRYAIRFSNELGVNQDKIPVWTALLQLSSQEVTLQLRQGMQSIVKDGTDLTFSSPTAVQLKLVADVPTDLVITL